MSGKKQKTQNGGSIDNNMPWYKNPVIVSGIIGGIIGAIVSGGLLYIITENTAHEQIITQQKSVAKALKIEIDANAPLLTVINNGLDKSPVGNGFVINQQIYSGNGVYFSNQQTIASFKDQNLSRNLYTYYSDLVTAEENRKEILDIYNQLVQNSAPSSPDFNRTLTIFTSQGISANMKSSIDEAVGLIPTLDSELQKEIDS
jgi:hypothetical protein